MAPTRINTRSRSSKAADPGKEDTKGNFKRGIKKKLKKDIKKIAKEAPRTKIDMASQETLWASFVRIRRLEKRITYMENRLDELVSTRKLEKENAYLKARLDESHYRHHHRHATDTESSTDSDSSTYPGPGGGPWVSFTHHADNQRKNARWARKIGDRIA